MDHPEGESNHGALRVNFDRRLKLEFHGSHITSDAGLLAYRELDDAFGLVDLAGSILSDGRTGKNTRHLLTGLFRQLVFGRLAGYKDVNDADRLAHDPAMRAVMDRNGLDREAASTSQMGRFETGWLTNGVNGAHRVVKRATTAAETRPARPFVIANGAHGRLRKGFALANGTYFTIVSPPGDWIARSSGECRFKRCGQDVRHIRTGR